MNKRTTDYHKQVAEKIISMLEAGTPPWEMPWEDYHLPLNGVSKRRYRGINTLHLLCEMKEKNYNDPRWYTFHQAKEAGAKIKAGAKSIRIQYWKFDKKEKDEEGNEITVPLDHPVVFYSNVFNAEQIEGLPPYQKTEHKWDPVERAEKIIAASNVPVIADSLSNNYYSPSRDEIHTTPRSSFKTAAGYYSTVLHEVGHSTGHASRLNRDMSGKFGTPSYAKEELRAEIASMMLGNDLGINREGDDDQHAAYVDSWIKALKDDPAEIFRASADAEKICNYLYEREKVYEQTLEAHKAVSNENIQVNEIKNDEIREAKARIDNILQHERMVNDMAPTNPMSQLGKELPPASEAQKNFAAKLGLHFEENIAKDELSKMIGKKLDLDEKMNGPATTEQIKSLQEAGKEVKENITMREASEIIKNLPPTKEQLDQLQKFKIEYEENNITRGVASKLLNTKIKELEENGNQPISAKQKEALEKIGFKITPDMTAKEASAALNAASPTEKQLAYIEKYKLELDKSKPLTYGTAHKLIENHQQAIEAAKNAPATEKQLEFLAKSNIEFKEGITAGEASKLIYQYQTEKSFISEKQMQYCADNKIEYPETATKADVSKLIGEHKRTAAINEFSIPAGNLKISQEYKKMAQEMLKAGKNIDDKKIAGELLKKNFSKNAVVTTIFNYSPNCVNEISKAQCCVTSAMKMPTVKKAMEKQASQSR